MGYTFLNKPFINTKKNHEYDYTNYTNSNEISDYLKQMLMIFLYIR